MPKGNPAVGDAHTVCSHTVSISIGQCKMQRGVAKLVSGVRR
jgi:hypothetical protein